jgi:hypothetical protein
LPTSRRSNVSDIVAEEQVDAERFSGDVTAEWPMVDGVEEQDVWSGRDENREHDRSCSFGNGSL